MADAGGILVNCDHCGALVQAATAGAYGVEDDHDYDNKIVLTRCMRCHQPALLHQAWNNRHKTWETVKILYPPQDRQLGHAVPDTIRAAYNEAFRCFRAQALSACAVMCRRVLEGVCRERGAKGRNFVQMLSNLKEIGEIDDRLLQWGHALRMIGNEAAHDVLADVTKEDAEDVLDFTEAILEYLYTFRKRFDQFRSRRANNQKP